MEIYFLVVIVFILSILVIYLVLTKRDRVRKLHDELRLHEQEYSRIQNTITSEREKVSNARGQLEAVFHLLAVFSQASNEDEVIREVLDSSVSLFGARGASYIPLDDQGQLQIRLNEGQPPQPGMEAWFEYLASPAIRQQCQDCNQHGVIATSCPLLKGSIQDVAGMYCLPLASNQREFGVLNLYMPDRKLMEDGQAIFLKTVLDATVLALESIRLRQREIHTLRQLQQVQQKNDLSCMLQTLVEDLHASLECDLALLVIDAGDLHEDIHTSGEYNPAEKAILQGLLEGTVKSGQSIHVKDVTSNQNSPKRGLSILTVPIGNSDTDLFGALLVGKRDTSGFHQKYISLLQTISDQIRILIENNLQLAQLEYRTIIQERARLAREIHDGLAQTLGFLKLQTIQMIHYLDQNDLERLSQALSVSYHAIDDTFRDVRGTIDGLRIQVSPDGFTGWLGQIVDEFRDFSGITASLEGDQKTVDFPPEIQAQLIRIIQEGLNNIRKHASATQVKISYHVGDGELSLKIQDNGEGFTPEDVLSSSHHGLKGMRERTELIGGEFRIESHRGLGTTIHIRVPLTDTSPAQEESSAGFGNPQ